MSEVKSETSRPRGRPRSVEAREAILSAAARLIEEGGIGAVTMEAVAHRAKVGKPTIYRSWPNREALAMAAILAMAIPKTNVRETSSALEDLSHQLSKVIDAFSSNRGRNAALMIASADPDSEIAKAFRNQVMLASRKEGHALLSRAMTEGSIRKDVKIDVVLDMLYGAIFYRLLIGHASLGEPFVSQLIEEALRGFNSTSSGRG